jgi:hypothetical protein
MLTVHSPQQVQLSIEEDCTGALDRLVHTALLRAQGSKEVEKRPGQYRLVQRFFEDASAFAFGIENLGARTCEVTLDCILSRNMLFSVPGGKATKLVEPGRLEFFMYSEAAPGAEEIARAAKVTNYKEIY